MTKKSVVKSSTQLMRILSPPGEFVNANLIDDVLNIFVPALIKTIQTIPIPHLEISTPEIDLHLENTLLTPGRTRNRTFLPLQFKVSTTNDLTVRATHTNAVASTTRSQTTVSFSGPSVAARDVPFLLCARAGAPAPRRRARLLSPALDTHGADAAATFSPHRRSPDRVATLDRVRARAPGGPGSGSARPRPRRRRGSCARWSARC
jgi:hypothetical protein